MQIVQNETGTTTDRIRKFTYSSGRMTSDKWYDALPTETLRRETTFSYTNDALSQVKHGGTGGIVYTVASLAKDATTLSGTPSGTGDTQTWSATGSSLATAPARTATVELVTDISTNGDWFTKFTFDSANNIIQRDELFGTNAAPTKLRGETWTYDYLRSAVSYVDALNRPSYFEYDYNPLTESGPKYARENLRGNVVRATTLAGVALFEYENDPRVANGLGLLKRTVASNGLESVFVRNEAGQPKTLTVGSGPASATESWDYYKTQREADSSPTPVQFVDDTKAGLLAQHIDALGLETLYGYDNNRRLNSVQAIDAGPDQQADTGDDEVTFTEYAYDLSTGFVDKVTVYAGADSTAPVLPFTDDDYSASGLLRSVVVKDRDGVGATIWSSQTYEYDPDGLVRRSANGIGAITAFSYDSRGLLTQRKEAVGASYANNVGIPASIEQTTFYSYFTDGSLKETDLPNGAKVTETYLPLTYEHKTSIDQVATTTSIDASGTISTDTTASSTTRQKFDLLDRVLEDENLLTGAFTKYEYLDRRHNAPTRVTENVNLGAAQPAAAFTLADVVTQLAYDQLGNVVFEKQDGLAARSYMFDKLGRMTRSQVLTALGAQFDDAHDAAGNVTQQTEVRKTPKPDGSSGFDTESSVTGYAYDESDRLRSVDEGPAGTATTGIQFETDTTTGTAVRRITTTSREGLVTTLAVNGAGQVVAETNAYGGVTEYEHDAAGNVRFAREQHPNTRFAERVTEFKYDALNRVRETIQHGAFTTDATSLSTKTDYDPDGPWQVITTDPAGAQTKTKLDSLGNLVAVQQADPGQNALSTNADDDAPITLYTYTYAPAQRAYAVTTRVTSQRGQNHLLNPASYEQSAGRTEDETHVGRQVFNTRGQLVMAASLKTGLTASSPTSDASNTTTLISTGFERSLLNSYDLGSQLRVATDGTGKKTFYDYDNQYTGTGLIRSESTVENLETFFAYDSAGNRVALRQVRGDFDSSSSGSTGDPADNVTAWVYDRANRVTKESVVVDTLNVSNAVVGSEIKDRVWRYDGLQTTYADRNGYVTTTELDPATKTRTVRTEHSELASLEYDATFQSNADGTLHQASDFWTDPPTGNSSRDGDRSQVVIEYDEFGRANSTTEDFQFFDVNAPTTKQTVTYTAAGARATDTWSFRSAPPTSFTPLLTNTYHVDKLNRVDGLSQEVFNTTDAQQYWFGGLVASDKSFAIAYNSDGSRERLDRFSDKQYSTVNANALVSHTLYSFTLAGELKELNHLREGTGPVEIASYANGFDANGRLVSNTTTFRGATGENPVYYTGRQSLGYDTSGQLANVGPDAAAPLANAGTPNGGDFGRDDAGNRTADEAFVGRQNLLHHTAEHVYHYDAEGNLVQDDGQGPLPTRDYTWACRVGELERLAMSGACVSGLILSPRVGLSRRVALSRLAFFTRVVTLGGMISSIHRRLRGKRSAGDA